MKQKMKQKTKQKATPVKLTMSYDSRAVSWYDVSKGAPKASRRETKDIDPAIAAAWAKAGQVRRFAQSWGKR